MAGVPYRVGGEVDPLHQCAAIDPLAAGMPTLHGGRVHQVLAHIADVKRHGIHAGLREIKIAHQTHSAHHRLGGALHLGEASVFEGIGVKQNPQHGADVVARPEVLVFQSFDGLGVSGRSILPGGDLGLVGHKEVVEMP